MPNLIFIFFFLFLFWWYVFPCALQGYKSGISRLLASPRPPVESPQTSCAQANSPAPTGQTSFATNSNRVEWNGQTLSSKFEDVDSSDNPGAFLTQPAFGSLSHNASLLSHRVTGKVDDCVLGFICTSSIANCCCWNGLWPEAID